MKAQVDRMTAELLERYRHYLADLQVGLWSEAGFIEFRCRFRLQRDTILHSLTLGLPEAGAATDVERAILVVGVFADITKRLNAAIMERPLDNSQGSRPPDTGPKALARNRLIEKLQSDLAYFQRIPPRRRETECADEGEQTCRALLFELGATPRDPP